MKAKHIFTSIIALSISGFTCAQLPGYKLIFEENFDSPAWDDVKWDQKTYTHDAYMLSTLVGKSHLTQPDLSSDIYNLTGSSLKLGMFKEKAPASMHSILVDGTDNSTNACQADFRYAPAEGDCVGCIDCSEDYDFISGEFRTYEKFQYGYFEIKCKMPKGLTFWESFWLYSANNPDAGGLNDPDGGNWYNEIDIFEMGEVPETGFAVNDLTSNYHYRTYNTTTGQYEISSDDHDGVCVATPGQDLESNYHTYGLEWTPNYMAWYRDGKRIRLYSCNDFFPRHPLSLIVGFALHNYMRLDVTAADYGTNPIPCTAVTETSPAIYEIDHIRIYKKVQMDNFGSDAGGWNPAYHRRIMADMNNDGLEDIVGFGWSSVFVSLAYLIPVDYATDCRKYGSSDKIAFHAPKVWLNDLAWAQGWTPDDQIEVGDINGDNLNDLIAFGADGVRVAYNKLGLGTEGFTAADLKINNFGSNPTAGGWDQAYHNRFVADVNGDGKDDILGMGWSQVIVAITGPSGTAFLSPQPWLNGFCYANGWRNDKHQILMEDINNDGSSDIVGFGPSGVIISYGPSIFDWLSGTSNFSSGYLESDKYGYSASAGNWRNAKHLRILADMDGDGRKDIVGFGEDNVYLSFRIGDAPGSGFMTPQVISTDFCYNDGWLIGDNPRFVKDISGDSRGDLVGFHDDGVYAAVRLLGLGTYPTFEWRNYYGTSATSGDLDKNNDIRTLADVNGDGQHDIVCFADKGVMVSPASYCFRATNVDEVKYVTSNAFKLSELTLESSLKISPNPSNGQFKVAVEVPLESINTCLVVHNLLGKQIYMSKLPDGIIKDSFYLNIDLPNGTYILSLIANNSVQSSKRFVVVE